MKISGSEICRFICVLCLLPALLQAGPAREYTRSITREFGIARDGIVGVTNSYGNVDIRTWNDAKVKIEVTIIADARNEDAATEVFDRISIHFDNSTSAVRARTDIATVTGWKRWFNWGDSDDFKINYVVYTPKSVTLELNNKYGDIYTADMTGRVEVTLKYGDLRLGDIAGRTTITLAYADGVVKSVGDVELDLAYSDLSIDEAGDITLAGKYSDVQLGRAGNLDSRTGYVDIKADRLERVQNDGKYDDFIVGTLRSLDVSSKYSSFKVNGVDDFASMELSYGSVTLYGVHPGFTSIDISGSYADVSIDADDDAEFLLDVSAKFCDVKYYGVEILRETDESFLRTIDGYRGSSSAASHIKISMNYGGLKIR